MKNITLSIYFALILSDLVFGQSKRLDSLLKLNHLTTNSIEKTGILLNLQISYNDIGDFKNSKLYGTKALELATANFDTLSMIISLNSFGNTYSNQGLENVAFNYYSDALDLSERSNNQTYINLLYGALGVSYTNQGNASKALKYLKKGLENNIKLKNKKAYPGFYNNLGILYRSLEKYNLALDNYFKSIEICKEINNEHILMQTYNNMAFVYYQMGNMGDATTYYNKSLDLAIAYHDKFQEGIVLGNIGNIYLNQKNYSIAETYFLRALKIAEELSDLEGEVENNLNLSTLYEATGKSDKAFSFLKKYIKKNNDLIVTNNERDRQAQEIKSEYEKEKLALKKEQEKRDLVTKAEKNKQQYIIYSISIGFITVAILLIFLYKRYKLTNSQKVIIQNQKHLVEEKQKEILDSINYAERIQRTFLATNSLLDENLKEHFVFFKPKDVVSGDFYWANKLPNGNFVLVTADSTGHGVPGAIMSLLNITSLESAIKDQNIEPSTILNHTRKTIIERLKKDGSEEGGKDGMDCSCLLLDNQKTVLTYSAANNPVWIVRNNIELIELSPDKMPVGKHDNDNVSFIQHTVALKKGDVIYTLTDGMPDQFGGPKGKKYKYKNLKDLLISISKLPMNLQHQKINDTFNNWKGNLEQVDDVCVIGIKV
jgi:serine phosphatase RsbU (regulator of sigma subunit)/Tfp pilus assembly protein PilF